MDDKEVRLRIAEALIPHASRVGVNKPEVIRTACEELESYVIGKPDKPPARRKPASNNVKKE